MQENHLFKTGEICMSGMATFSRHSLPNSQKVEREEKRAWYIQLSISK
jgi:hypothetical protein